MARISWGEAIKRFTHIDARFVNCEIGLPEHDGFLLCHFIPGRNIRCFWRRGTQAKIGDFTGFWTDICR